MWCLCTVLSFATLLIDISLLVLLSLCIFGSLSFYFVLTDFRSMRSSYILVLVASLYII
jgi:hypothetical protein